MLGVIEVERVCKATGERVATSRLNTLTDNMFDVLLELLGQLATTTPSNERLHSIWIETDNPTIPDVLGTDDGPDAGSTVLIQYVFEDVDKTFATVNTSIGPLAAIACAVSIDGDTYDGSTVYAAGLYTRGTSSTPPNPALWTPGDAGVRLIARQLVGPLPIVSGFVFNLTWKIAFGRLPEELL